MFKGENLVVLKNQFVDKVPRRLGIKLGANHSA